MSGCTAPVLLAGGADGGDLTDTLTLFRTALDAGARGVMAGRRVYTSESPTAAMAAIRGLVHGGLTVDAASALAAGDPAAGGGR